MNRRELANQTKTLSAPHDRLSALVSEVRVPNTAIWFVNNRVLVSVTDMTGIRAKLAAAGWKPVPGTQDIYECYRCDPGFARKLQALVSADGLASCFTVSPEVKS